MDLEMENLVVFIQVLIWFLGGKLRKPSCGNILSKEA